MSLKEENLIAYNGTLKKGQRLVKVGNTFMPVGIGGAFEPCSGGGGSNNMKFYKCASVDTANKTWSGYELVLNDGKYNLSSEITTGLKYTSIIPTKDSIYSQDALIKVAFYAQNMPEDGLVFYAPLSEASATAATGQALTYFGSFAGFASEIGAYLGTNGIISFTSSSIPIGNSPRTITGRIKRLQTPSDDHCILFYGAMSKQYKACNIAISSDNKLKVDTWENAILSNFVIPENEITDFAITFDGTTSIIYINGILDTVSDTLLFNTEASSYTSIGDRWATTASEYHFDNGAVGSVRIYNRALTQEEITILANEFTPTTA